MAGDISGAAADLGVFLPLAAALVLVNGLDVSGVLVSAGVLALAAGALFRIPFPVQPLKALTAVAVGAGLEPGVIHAAGLEIGIFLLLLSGSGVADRLGKIFEKPVVRSLQVGVGLLLIQASARLLLNPPEVFSSFPGKWLLPLGILSLAGIAWSAYLRRYGILLTGLAVVVIAALLWAPPKVPTASISLPRFGLPTWGQFSSALFLLVIPQIPLTFGNAVVAVTDVARGYFGPAAGRVSAGKVCLSAGIGNLFSAAAGGMPMCHGAGGLTAHYRLGARTALMNAVLGGAMLVAGIFFAPHVLGFFGLVPVWVLSALLAYAGIRHALLLFDQRGAPLAWGLLAGLAGALLGNLAITTVIALTAHHGARWLQNLQPAPEV